MISWVVKSLYFPRLTAMTMCVLLDWEDYEVLWTDIDGMIYLERTEQHGMLFYIINMILSGKFSSTCLYQNFNYNTAD